MPGVIIPQIAVGFKKIFSRKKGGKRPEQQETAKSPTLSEEGDANYIGSLEKRQIDTLLGAKEILKEKADYCPLPFVRDNFQAGITGIDRALGSFPPYPYLLKKWLTG